MLRLKIDPVIRNAEDVKKRVERELPHHTGLIGLAAGVATAAREAEHAAQQLKKTFGWHRLPAVFLALALLMLIGWIYSEFFHVNTLTVSIPERDARNLRERLIETEGNRLKFKSILVSGSDVSIQNVIHKKADLGFVQGGIEIPADLPRLETPSPEIILYFVRDSISDLISVRRVLTSLSGAGSHTVARAFMKIWKLDSQIEFVHEWAKLTNKEDGTTLATIDAVFVVKDLADDETVRAIDRIAAAGFRLVSPDIGARVSQLDYLNSYVIPAGFLRSLPAFPPSEIRTYSVATYLVARKGLTPRMLAAASHLIDSKRTSLSDGRFEATLGETSDVIQTVDAFLGIIINIVLAFLALLGLEMLGYRKRFHELNSLISLISIHQSSKDVLGLSDSSVKRDHLQYLSLCSDLLGLVSMIAGYYTQENSSLLFNGMPEIIHQRCDGLKINIQLKILHASIDLEHAKHHPDSIAGNEAQISSHDDVS